MNPRNLVKLRLMIFKSSFPLQFSLLTSITVLLSFTAHQYIFTHDYYYLTLGEKLTNETIQKVFEFQEKWDWLGYLLTPVLMLVRYSITAFCLQTLAFIYDYKISYKKVIKVVMLSDFITLLSSSFNIILWLVYGTEYMVKHQSLSSLSLLSIFDSSNIAQWLKYPLSLLSVWELLYWIALSVGISFLIKKGFSTSVSYISKSYGLGLLLLVFVSIFLNI